jgi:hypothetical protein
VKRQNSVCTLWTRINFIDVRRDKTIFINIYSGRHAATARLLAALWDAVVNDNTAATDFLLLCVHSRINNFHRINADKLTNQQFAKNITYSGRHAATSRLLAALWDAVVNGNAAAADVKNLFTAQQKEVDAAAAAVNERHDAAVDAALSKGDRNDNDNDKGNGNGNGNGNSNGDGNDNGDGDGDGDGDGYGGGCGGGGGNGSGNGGGDAAAVDHMNLHVFAPRTLARALKRRLLKAPALFPTTAFDALLAGRLWVNTKRFCFVFVYVVCEQNVAY